MSSRQHSPYPQGPRPPQSKSVLEIVERSAALAGSLFMVLGLTGAATWALIVALACLLPGVAVRVKRAVWPAPRGRHGK
ncbi:hypothetical protein Acsp04_28230 [Actinomadura sp. NBRC 104425]|uniref:hypothetical protein n=1 Tax=Actinomadura sp. NBRC 104425 TaxID=3032204 RepID=UPI0024A21953|nr:hypothetical protein [Actinomadura sp. NBRC 104425]GLZ12588.1 hypothetical protein Acsp04_28230 [Actinomadura sp. NBRC 104425]